MRLLHEHQVGHPYGEGRGILSIRSRWKRAAAAARSADTHKQHSSGGKENTREAAGDSCTVVKSTVSTGEDEPQPQDPKLLSKRDPRTGLAHQAASPLRAISRGPGGEVVRSTSGRTFKMLASGSLISPASLFRTTGSGTQQVAPLASGAGASALIQDALAQLRCVSFSSLSLELMRDNKGSNAAFGLSRARPSPSPPYTSCRNPLAAVLHAPLTTGFAQLIQACKPGEIDFFVSHSWSDDATLKFAELERICVKFADENGRAPLLWVDKRV